jgi:hypothetical protein
MAKQHIQFLLLVSFHGSARRLPRLSLVFSRDRLHEDVHALEE